MAQASACALPVVTKVSAFFRISNFVFRVSNFAFHSYCEISSKTNPFVVGPIAPTTTATKIIATASNANTAGTPCTKTAPINIEVNAALNRLQL